MTSVAPPSPQVCRAKRSRLSTELEYCSPHGKRQRYVADVDIADISVRTGTVKQRLQLIFPDMDEKVIIRVLDTCQGDFDEALEKLTELSLTTNSSPTGDVAERTNVNHGAAIPSSSHRQQEETQKQPKVTPSSAGNLEDVQRWALALSEEVTSAVDQADLNRRIFQFLTLCKEHVERTQADATSTQLHDLQKQNAVLKKAVAIQHARLGKHAAEKEAQIQEMQTMLNQCQSRIQALEASNYALSLHLKQATANVDVFNDRPPDVY